MRHHKKNARNNGKSIVTRIRNGPHAKFAACKNAGNDAAHQHDQYICGRYRKNDGEIVRFLPDPPPYNVLHHTGAIGFRNHICSQQHEDIKGDIATQKCIKQLFDPHNRGIGKCQRKRQPDRYKQGNTTERKATEKEIVFFQLVNMSANQIFHTACPPESFSTKNFSMSSSFDPKPHTRTLCSTRNWFRSAGLIFSCRRRI